jgi:sugar phosphate isomerase/epimerase
MRLSCSVTDFPDAPLDRAAEIASSAGFAAIELFLTWGEGLAGGMQSNPASHVRRTLGKHDLVLSGLNGSNLSAIDDAGAQAQLETLSSEIAYASELGLTSLNVKGGDRNQPMGRFKELLAEACKRLPDGFDLNLGNHCGNRVENPEDLTEILDGAPKCVRVLLDSGHFLSANVDPVYVAREFPERMGLVHLRDQIHARPVPFGEGDLDFEALIKALREADYDGWLVVELEHLTDPPDVIERQKIARAHVVNALGGESEDGGRHRS